MNVAQTIANQLGGALQMIGARNLMALEDGLQFSIMNGAHNGINKIVIKLDPSDTYRVEFWKIGRAPKFLCTKISEHEDIYVDALHDLIERQTGLSVRIPRVRGINC